jgi:hypothetical protein
MTHKRLAHSAIQKPGFELNVNHTCYRYANLIQVVQTEMSANHLKMKAPKLHAQPSEATCSLM